MKRLSLLVSVLFLITSCGTKKVASSAEAKGIVLGKTEVLKYHSLGNGVADIDLKLYENNTFLFEFTSIPQPETKDKPIKILEKGTYSSEGQWRILHFKAPDFFIDAIFDPQYSSAQDFQVLDKETVKINTLPDGISIWGVFCEKQ